MDLVKCHNEYRAAFRFCDDCLYLGRWGPILPGRTSCTAFSTFRLKPAWLALSVAYLHSMIPLCAMWRLRANGSFFPDHDPECAPGSVSRQDAEKTGFSADQPLKPCVCCILRTFWCSFFVNRKKKVSVSVLARDVSFTLVL